MSVLRSFIESQIGQLSPNQRYTYNPLLSSSLTTAPKIRLLRLLPHRNPEAEIRCRIFEVEIGSSSASGGKSDAPYFEALSYVWGHQKGKKRVFIGHKYIDVTANLYAALLRLRGRKARVLWVDALCINQEDVAERAAQVRLMATIYSSAQLVIAWLGEEKHGSANALSLIRSAAAYDEDLQGGPMQPVKGDDRGDCYFFLRRPYFSRVWILQEAAAAQKVVFLCGAHEVSGVDFASGVRKLQIKYPEMIDSVCYLILYSATPSSPETGLTLHRSKLSVLPLRTLADMFQSQSATDLRDKIFALIGMSSDNVDDIRIDYTSPWSKVFGNFLQHIFGDMITAYTWNKREYAVIYTSGCTLGRVTSFTREATSRMIVTVQSGRSRGENKTPIEWQGSWELPRIAKPVQEHDIVCWLRGLPGPSIIRPQKTQGIHGGYFSIVCISMGDLIELMMPDMGKDYNSRSFFHETNLGKLYANHDREFALSWNWERDKPSLEAVEARQDPLEAGLSPDWVVPGEFHLDNEHNRYSAMAAVFEDLGDSQGIHQVIQAAPSRPGNATEHADNLSDFAFVQKHWEPYLALKLKLDNMFENMALTSNKWSGDRKPFRPPYGFGEQTSSQLGLIEISKLPRTIDPASADVTLTLAAGPSHADLQHETMLLTRLFDNYLPAPGGEDDPGSSSSSSSGSSSSSSSSSNSFRASWNLQFLARTCLEHARRELKQRRDQARPALQTDASQSLEEVLSVFDDAQLVLLTIGDQLQGHAPIDPANIAGAFDHPTHSYQSAMMLLKCSDDESTYRIAKAIADKATEQDEALWERVLTHHFHVSQERGNGGTDFYRVAARALAHYDEATLSLLRKCIRKT